IYGALVDGPSQALHHVELAPDHLTRGLVPQRPRRTDRRRLEGAEDAELLAQVVRLEQAGGRRTHPQYDVVALVAGGEGEEQRLGRVAEVDPVEPLDRDLGSEPLGEPGRQLVLHPLTPVDTWGVLRTSVRPALIVPFLPASRVLADVPERHILVGARLGREAEDPLPYDVHLDLLGAPLDPVAGRGGE